MSMEKCKILGVNINVINMQNTVKLIEENLMNLKGNYICVSNVHTTVMAYEDKEYKKIQNGGFMALPDGKPLSIVSKERGFKDAQRITGPDLMGELFKLSKEKGYTHYFYGSTVSILNKLKSELKNEYPNLKVVGMYSPPFNEITTEDDHKIIKDINDVKADFLWVGLGAPKQERWMYEHRNKVNSLMIGVGAGFDYYSKQIIRAPMWMQKMSLEWVYRLMQDPKRLWKRYFITNSKFIYYLIKLKCKL